MAQVTVWMCHPVGDTSVTYYVGVDGSYATNLVPSGYNVCSDPFLQDVVGVSDGTNYEYNSSTATLDYDTECRLTANQTTLGGSVFGLDASSSGGLAKDTLYAITQTNNSNPWYTNCNHDTIHTDFYFPQPVLATNIILQHRGGSKAHLYYGMIYAGDSTTDLANHTYTLYDSGFVNRGGGAYVNTSVTPSRAFQYYRVDWHNSGSDGGSNGGMIYIKFEGTKIIHESTTYNLADSDNVQYRAIVKPVDYPYAHYNGTIYQIADAPSGAFGITETEKDSLEDAISDGGTLAWYSNQRPYVYQYVSWTQPVLTSNSTSTALGTVVASASSYYSGEEPWEGMNGIHSGTGHDYWTSSGASGSAVGEWWQVVFPYKIKITGLTYYNRYNHDGTWSNITGRFWTSSARTTSIGNSFGPTGNGNWTATAVTGIPASGVLTDTIYLYFTAAATKYAAVGEIDITATRREMLYEVPKRYLMQLIPAISESGAITNYYSPAIAPAHPYAHYEGTIYDIADAPAGAYPLTDLQYYTINYYVNAGGTLAWYSNQRPYVFTLQSWTQPVLTSNTSYGVVSASSYYTGGGGRFPYYALDGDATTMHKAWVASDGTTPQWWKWELPITLRLSSVSVYNAVAGSDRAKNIRLYSDDGVTAISDTVTLSNDANANVITLYSGTHDITQIYIACSDKYATYIGLQEVQLTGQEFQMLYEVPLTNFVS